VARGLRIALTDGDSLPEWRTAMSENTRIDLGLNTQADMNPKNDASVNPAGAGNDEPWKGVEGYGGTFGYVGFNYAPDSGAYGSIVGTCGGHGAYFGNWVRGFDIETRLFKRYSDPYGSLSHPGSFYQDGSQGSQHGDNVNGELFIDGSPAFTTDQTQPGAFQGYNSNFILPANTGGAGAKGALVTPVRSARTPGGNAENGSATGRAHIFDLDQASVPTAAWERFSSNVAAPASGNTLTGWSAYDPTRNKCFVGAENNFSTHLNVLNCATGAWDSAITLTGANIGGGAGSMYMHQFVNAFHWLANPDYLIHYVDPTRFALINVATGVCYAPGLTGVSPSVSPALVGGTDWVESAQKLVLYEGGSTSDNFVGSGGLPDRVWIITPPSTTDSGVFTTTPWTVTYEDVTGPTPPVQVSGIPHGRRFLWCEAVQCFIWWANGTDSVQAWVVNGFGE
jgi:hypothetical protein